MAGRSQDPRSVAPGRGRRRWRNLSLVVALAAAGVGWPTAFAASSPNVWALEQSATSPTPYHEVLNGYYMEPYYLMGPSTFDARSGQVVLFSHQSDATREDRWQGPPETWTWASGSGWTLTRPSVSPPSSDGGALAYDAISQSTVLYDYTSDDQNHLISSSTWLWNGSTQSWSSAATATPSPRAFASMAYLPATKSIVLFGGATGGSEPLPLGETWSWSGVTRSWTRLFPRHSPPARYGAAMAYDAVTGELVLAGGQGCMYDPYPNAPACSFMNLEDTWTFDGTDWTEQAVGGSVLLPVGPMSMAPGPDGHVMTFSSNSIEFTAETPYPQQTTFAWTGSTWAVDPANGPVLYTSTMAYDPLAGADLLVGPTVGTQPGALGAWVGPGVVETWRYGGT